MLDMSDTFITKSHKNNMMTKTTDNLFLEIAEIRKTLSEQTKTWLRTNEAAEYLSISNTQLHLLKQNGILPFSKIGGTLYFKKSDIDQILETNKCHGGLE